MRASLDWQPAPLRATRDVTPDIRLLEIEPAGRFVAPTPGSNIAVAGQIGDRPDVRS